MLKRNPQKYNGAATTTRFALPIIPSRWYREGPIMTMYMREPHSAIEPIRTPKMMNRGFILSSDGAVPFPKKKKETTAKKRGGIAIQANTMKVYA